MSQESFYGGAQGKVCATKMIAMFMRLLLLRLKAGSLDFLALASAW